jgi:membrane protease YdiL (CAAX protease family)
MPFIYLPGLNFIYEQISPTAELYWYDLAYYYFYVSILSALVVGLVSWYKLNWRLMFQDSDPSDYLPSVKLTAFVFVFSIAAAYALFYPLSFLFPDFVQVWLIELPPLIKSAQGEFAILANLLNLITLVVLAPIIEEFTFRGILLHRWTQKWSMNSAILISSLLFGIVHTDPIGAFVFGVAMCIIYLKTQTLVVPIICHALNNLVIWLIEVGYFVWQGPEQDYTLQDYQSDWIPGVVAAIVVCVWVYVYFKSNKSQTVWRLPKL